MPRMGWQNILPGGDAIDVRVQKTGVPLVLPISPDLRAAYDAMPKGMNFLTLNGHAFKPGDFSQWFAAVPRCRCAARIRRPRAA
jgi:hypothetical protein